MSLNISSAWGDPYSDWKTAQSSSLGSYFQFFNSTSGVTWDWLRSNGYQRINQESLDYTIAPWRISKDSALVDINGWYWYNDYNTDPDTPNTADRYNAHINGFSMLEEKYNVPFILNLKGSTNDRAPWTGYYGYYFDDGHTAVRLNTSKPVVNFRYDKIKVLPTFWFTATDISRAVDGNPPITQYGGVPDFATIEDTPYCVGVGFRIYIDKAGTWTEVALTPAIDTHFTGNDTPSEITGWFCLDGMKILREPYAANKSGTHYNNWFYGQSTGYNLVWEGSPTGGWTHGDLIAKASSFRRPESAWTNSISIGRGQLVSGTVSRFDDLSERLDGTSNDGGTYVGAFHFAKIDSDNYDVWVEDVKKQLAYIGLPFILTNAYLTDDFDSDNVYLPVFDSQRCTTGEFKHGADNSSLINYNWRWIYELDPLPEDIPPTPPEPTDTGDLDNYQTRDLAFNGSNKYYLITQSQLDTITSAVNAKYTSDGDTVQMELDFKGSNPFDYVVGLYGLPFTYTGTVSPVTSINLGAVSIPAAANLITSDIVKKFDFGSISIPAYYNDFRDFSPYTSIQVYVPLCGTVELDPADYIGHSVQVHGILDVQTGAVTMRILRDGRTITHTLQGNAYIQIPLTMSAMGSYQNNQHQLEMSMYKTYGNFVFDSVGKMLPNPAQMGEIGQAPNQLGLVQGGFNAFIDLSNLKYQIDHTQPSISTTGAASSANAANMYQKAKLFIKRPLMLPTYNATAYGKTIGFACCKNTTVGDNNGLTVCADADLSGLTATAAEITAIKTLLTSGIYV